MAVEVNNIPSEVYIKAKQVRDIFVMSMNGLEDVNLTSVITGLDLSVGRNELVKNYRWYDNKRIMLCGCKKTKKYMVAKGEDAQCTAVYIPAGNKVKMPDGEVVDVGKASFLINDSRYEEPFLLDRSLFKVAYIYTENPASVAERIKCIGKPEEHTHRKARVRVKKLTEVESDTNTNVETKPVLYKAVARYVRGKETLGFKLLTTQGEYKDINAAGAAKLALNDKIVNLAWSDGGVNKAHFRGKGINIADLPVIRK